MSPERQESTAARFLRFATEAASGGSPLYAEWSRELAARADVLAVVERARPSQRQPVLVFGVCRILGCPLGSAADLCSWILRHADAIVAELERRYTQTNDVRRVGPVAVALSRIPGPVALLEVGASAGLGLYPDRYKLTIKQDAVENSLLGDPTSSVHIDLRVEGHPLLSPNARLPRIAWRAGLDLVPLDVGRDDDVRWLATLLWPGQDDRVRLLHQAVAMARQDPAPVFLGDAVDGLAALVATIPPGLTPVVVTSGTLVYLPGARRQAFVDLVGELGVRWISYERTGLLTGVHATLQDPAPLPLLFATLALDGEALATGDAHGTLLRRR